MTNSHALGSTLTQTKMRTPNDLCGLTGMCSVCTLTCPGSCEIGYSAVRGIEAIYPTATDQNQFASIKNYPLSFGDFNINGRVFGGGERMKDPLNSSFQDVKLTCHFGLTHPIQLKAPIILPAMAKLNWKDYFAGAAVAGVCAVIGEDVIAKDTGLVEKDGKVIHAPLIEQMINSFRNHAHGYGDIILQANADDERKGVLDYAITKLGVKSIEFKFGQASKGIQGVSRIHSLMRAKELKEQDVLVYPDPTDEGVEEAWNNGYNEPFEKIGRLPFWDEAYMKKRIQELRDLGVERICFKSGPYHPEDLMRLVQIAVENDIDLITIDGAGGGTGNSPVKMMNEWGIPTVELIVVMRRLFDYFQKKGCRLPQLAIGGGITTEDQAFKAMAIGAPYVQMVAIGRGAMAAAMTGHQVGELIEKGQIPQYYSRFGDSVDGIFADYKRVQNLYGSKEQPVSTGAVGVYSYLERLNYGIKQLLILNRKFDIKEIAVGDVVPLTEEAARKSGLPSYLDQLTHVLNP